MKDDDELSITSRDSATAVRKISKTGPGKAWYRGYMTNFKGEASEFAPVSGRNTPQEASPRNSKEGLHSSQKSVQGRELPRPQSASEMRNVFINNSLDEIQVKICFFFHFIFLVILWLILFLLYPIGEKMCPREPKRRR